MPRRDNWHLGKAMSFMKISDEYGRKLCSTALQKLQQAAEEEAFEPALLGV